MDRTGFILSLADMFEDKWQAFHLRSESKEEFVYNKNLDFIHKKLKYIHKQPNISLFIDIERLILNDDLKRYANSPEEMNSIKAAIIQLEEGAIAFGIVQNKGLYRASYAVFSSKHKESGLPLDAFRMFIKSHTARLTNRLTAPLSVIEKNILRQRKANLQIAKAMYIELQNMALGIV